jgi:hypothetical protein
MIEILEVQQNGSHVIKVVPALWRALKGKQFGNNEIFSGNGRKAGEAKVQLVMLGSLYRTRDPWQYRE